MAVRPYKTKTDKMMGFVTIEDLQGPIELVIFPKTWDKTRALCEQGRVVVVDGKVDSSGQPIKVLVDDIKTEVTFYEAAPTPLENRKGKSANPVSRSPQPASVKGAVAASRPVSALPAAHPMANTPVNDFIPDPDDGLDGAPPPPEFPPDWENYSVPNRQYGFGVPASPEPAFFPEESVGKPESGPAADASAPGDGQKAEPAADEPAVAASLPELVAVIAREPEAVAVVTPPAGVELIPEAGLAINAVIESLELNRPPLPIAPPQAIPRPEFDNAPPQLISILMRPSGNPERDRRRIKHIYGILISYPGKDRFSFRIYENGKGYLLDFPNDTTRVCPDMLERLKRLIGEDGWRVEPLVYQ